MPILNYTTKVSAEKTAMEIQRILQKGKAKAVLCEYYDDGDLESISFQIQFKDNRISYRLPSRADPILRILEEDPKVPLRFATIEQATRVAWRITKDWVDAQLAFVEAEQADLGEVFLPYAEIAPGTTIYQRLKANGFSNLLTHDG